MAIYPFETRPTPCVICQDDVDQPLDVFAALAAGPGMISTALRADAPGSGDWQSPALATPTPKVPSPLGWSLQEVAAHLADLEVHRGVRVRRILAEDNPAIEPLDQDAWTTALHAADREVQLSVDTFAINRRSILKILDLAGPEALARPFQHHAFGHLTLGALMDHTTHHDLAHLRQILGE